MEMPRFALLLHDSPRGWHCDFFLEVGDVLKTWALPALPEPGVEMECDALADHRLLYLDYEGPISGDRGSVTRWDSGTYTTDRIDRTWVVKLVGTKLCGRVTLCKSPESTEKWMFCWEGS